MCRNPGKIFRSTLPLAAQQWGVPGGTKNNRCDWHNCCLHWKMLQHCILPRDMIALEWVPIPGQGGNSEVLWVPPVKRTLNKKHFLSKTLLLNHQQQCKWMWSINICRKRIWKCITLTSKKYICSSCWWRKVSAIFLTHAVQVTIPYTNFLQSLTNYSGTAVFEESCTRVIRKCSLLLM